MMRRTSFVAFASVALLLCLAFAASSSAEVQYSYSPSAYWGNGAFRTYFAQDGEVPVSLGFEFSAAFFHDIPPLDQVMPDMPGMTGMAMGKLPLPLIDLVPVYTPFQSFELEYSSGHPYPYNMSHFDIYWFFQNADTRDSNITASSTTGQSCNGISLKTWCYANISLAKQCCPPAYGNIGLTLPSIGSLLIDFLATENLPPTDPRWTPFQMSLGYVQYMGRITGYRAMVSWLFYQTFLKGATKKCVPYRLPAEFADPGYYPSSMCTYLTLSGNLRTELTDFKLYSDGCNDPPVPGTCAFMPRAPLQPQCYCH